jgi:hypothetical protein
MTEPTSPAAQTQDARYSPEQLKIVDQNIIAHPRGTTENGYVAIAIGYLEQQRTIAAKNAEIARLHSLLKRADTALQDWLNVYASDMCDPKRVEEAQKRIGEVGTLAYVTFITDEIERALHPQSPGTAATEE